MLVIFSVRLMESLTHLSVSVAVLLEWTSEEFQFSWEIVLFADGCGSVHQDGKHRILTGWVVV
jgi:hypothetical protein